jgi:hypothetical protein
MAEKCAKLVSNSAHRIQKGLGSSNPPLRAPLDEQTVVGKPRLQSLGIVSDLTTKHAFAGSAGQRKFDALPEVIALPQRQDLEMLAVVGEAADEGITNAKRQRETASK